MRFQRAFLVGVIPCASVMWIACGGDDAAVNGDDTTSDSGVTDATTGDGGNTGTDSGNPSDSGAQDSASGDDSGCHVAFPSLPAGQIVCPGAPGGECDGGSCCVNACASGNICISTAGHVTCERASDCDNDRVCCLKLNAAIDLDASTCPLTATLNSTSCALAIDNECTGGDYTACASDAECDGGTCRALSVQVLDGGTILGVCAP